MVRLDASSYGVKLCSHTLPTIQLYRPWNARRPMRTASHVVLASRGSALLLGPPVPKVRCADVLFPSVALTAAYVAQTTCPLPPLPFCRYNRTSYPMGRSSS